MGDAVSDTNKLVLEYLSGALASGRKKRLAQSAGLLEELPPEGAPGEEVPIDEAELEALLAAEAAAPATEPTDAVAAELPANGELPPELPPVRPEDEDEEEV